MDWQSVQPIFSWLSDNPGWAGFFVFLIALSESLLIVGLIVPGTVLMFGVGTLVGTGVLDMKQTMFIAFLGAVVGDGISFWIGVRYRDQLTKFWPFNKKPQYLENGQRFFLKHGGKSILFGRFVGPVRPIIPAVAGMMGMPARNFLFVNVISAIGWAPFYLIPGIVFGTSIGLASQVGSRLVIMLLSIFVITILLFWLTRKIMLFVLPRADSYFQSIYQWASKHPKIGQYVLAIIDPHTSERRGLVAFSLLGISLLLIIAFLIAQISHKDALGIDSFVSNLMLVIRSDYADYLFLFVQDVSSWPVVSFAILNAALLFYAFKHYFALIHLLIIIVLSVLSLLIIELLLSVSGAGDNLLALIKLVFIASSFSLLALIVCARISQAKRWFVYAVVLFCIVMLSLSDLYFGYISFSSLVITLGLVLVWVVIVGLAYQRHALAIKQTEFIGSTTLAVLLVMSVMSFESNFDRNLNALDNKLSQTQISYAQWQNEIWKNLSSYRVDVFGREKQFFNLQWLAELEEIETSLFEQGWQKPVSLNFRTFLYWLKPNLEITEFARFPQTNNGLREQLVLVKYSDDKQKQLVLQLWPSKYILNEEQQSLWIGSVTYQTLDNNMKWIPYLKISDEFNHALQAFKLDVKAWQTQEFMTSENDLLLIDK